MNEAMIPNRLRRRVANSNENYVFMERMPRDVIIDIQPNPVAQELLHPGYQYLATEDWLADNVLFTTSPKETASPVDENSPHLIAPTPKSWTRAVSLWDGQFPYDSLVGGTIMAKGCSISGESFEKEQVDEDGPNIPWGFFGTVEAHQEQEISNALLLAGARVALPLGYVVIDPSRLASELEQRIESPQLRSRVLTQLKKVEQNGDYPALYSRITGVRERLSNFHLQPKRRRFMHEVARGASLLLAEERLNPGKIDQYLFPFQGEITSGEVLPVIDKIASRQRLNGDELDNFFYLLAGIIKANAKAIETYYSLGDEPKYGDIGMIASYSKDICLAFITQDFEQASPPRETNDQVAYRNYRDYHSAMGNNVANFLNEQFIGRYLPGYLRAGFGRRVKERLLELIFT